MKLSGPPTGPVSVPPSVAAFARGRRLEPVWRNELGGLTFRMDGDETVFIDGDETVSIDGNATVYVKWAPPGSPSPRRRGRTAALGRAFHPRPRGGGVRLR